MKLRWQDLRFDETRIGTATGYKKIVRVLHMPTGETVTIEGDRESMRELRDRATVELEQRVAAVLEQLRNRATEAPQPLR